MEYRMNNRIEELAKQAGSIPLEPRTFADDLNEIFLQKFAKLIVRECISIANQSNVTGKSIIGQRIKNHFGVE